MTGSSAQLSVLRHVAAARVHRTEERKTNLQILGSAFFCSEYKDEPKEYLV